MGPLCDELLHLVFSYLGVQHSESPDLQLLDHLVTAYTRTVP